MLYQELLNEIVSLCTHTIGDHLTGIYLHGSLAMGCFHPNSSDIDIIVVSDCELSDPQKICLMWGIVKLNSVAPAKGLEIHFLNRSVCRPFVYPTPFELHFSPMRLNWFLHDPHDYIQKMHGTDKDLASHITVLNHRGITIHGDSIPTVFGSVSAADYLDSIWHDIESAPNDILENPVYVILNLCRTWAYLTDNLILSKAEGGEWGLMHLDQDFHPLISHTLNCYQSSQQPQMDADTALQFSATMLAKIKSKL